MPMDKFRTANREQWDERVAIHYPSAEYNVGGFVEDPESLSGVVAFDRRELGDVSGKSLLHLQCHFGRDTLSWARLGARVTGLDFSERAIEAARRLSAESGTPGRFLVAELYGARSVLDEQFDIVYTGVGALCWLPDIRGWAQVVSAFLKPGGVFYIREGHPMLAALDDEREDGALVLKYPYFERAEPLRFEGDRSYAGEGRLEKTVSYEWSHGLGETIAALLEAGLRLEAVREYRFLDWKGLPCMVRGEDGLYRLPEALRDRVPLQFSLRAVKERI